MKQKPFFHPNGTVWPRPTSKAEAILLGYKQYADVGNPCPCGEVKGAAIRYVENNECRDCVRRREHAAIDASETTCYSQNQALQRNQPGYYTVERRPCDFGPHVVYKDIRTGACLRCKEDNKLRRESAYMPTNPCSQCARKVKRNTVDHSCTYCGHIPRPYQTVLIGFPDAYRIPRTTAARLGFIYYVPDKPCSRCNTFATRYVKSGGCTECLGIKK